MHNQPKKIEQIIDTSQSVTIQKTHIFRDNLELIGHTYAQIKELQIYNKQWKLRLKTMLVFFRDSNTKILWTLALVTGFILWSEFKNISKDAQFCAERPQLQECIAKDKEPHPFSRFMWVFFNTMPIGILALLIKLADDQVVKPIADLEQSSNSSETNFTLLKALQVTINSYPETIEDEAELVTLANAREILYNTSFEHQKNSPDFGHITLLKQKNLNLLNDKLNSFDTTINHNPKTNKFTSILTQFKK